MKQKIRWRVSGFPQDTPLGPILFPFYSRLTSYMRWLTFHNKVIFNHHTFREESHLQGLIAAIAILIKLQKNHSTTLCVSCGFTCTSIRDMNRIPRKRTRHSQLRFDEPQKVLWFYFHSRVLMRCRIFLWFVAIFNDCLHKIFLE